MSKYREWRLPLTTLIINSDETRPNGTHVIEHSAYVSLKERSDNAWREKAEKLEQELAEAKTKHEAYVEHLKSRYQTELAEAHRQIKAGWKDWTIIDERDAALKELTEAKAEIAQWKITYDANLEERDELNQEIERLAGLRIKGHDRANAHIQSRDALIEKLVEALEEIRRVSGSSTEHWHIAHKALALYEAWKKEGK